MPGFTSWGAAAALCDSEPNGGPAARFAGEPARYGICDASTVVHAGRSASLLPAIGCAAAFSIQIEEAPSVQAPHPFIYIFENAI